FLRHFAALIDQLPLPGNGASSAVGAEFFLQYRRSCPDRLANKDGCLELPVANAQKGERAHGRAVYCQTTGHGEHEQAVRDGLSERGSFGKLMIEVDWIKV